MASLTSSDEDVVFSGSAASEGVSISVHPLPLLNISEHYTRVRIQAQSSTGSNDDDVKGPSAYTISSVMGGVY